MKILLMGLSKIWIDCVIISIFFILFGYFLFFISSVFNIPFLSGIGIILMIFGALMFTMLIIVLFMILLE